MDPRGWAPLTGKWLARALAGVLILVGILLIGCTPVFHSNPGGTEIPPQGWCTLVGGGALVLMGVLTALKG